MSMLDRFQSLFRKKGDTHSPDDSVVALDGALPSMLAESDASPRGGRGDATRMAGDGELTDAIAVPLLGQRTAAQHQRTLSALLAIGLVVLGGVTVVTLGQTDTVSQQVAASGQALMQSQRLAKSVSQDRKSVV